MPPRIAIPFPHSDAEYAKRALPQYEEAVRRAGGEPVVVPLHVAPEEAMRIMNGCDGVLLPGSKADVDPAKYDTPADPRTNPADTARDTIDELLLQDAYNMQKPLLGICYGVQILNVYRTGTLLQHLETGVNHNAGRAVEYAHDVTIEAPSRLKEIVGGERIRVNSSHHQALKTIGDGLRVVAQCPEDEVIEAVEGTLPEHWVVAVQWHPERSTDESSRNLFAAFVEAAREWAAKRAAVGRAQ